MTLEDKLPDIFKRIAFHPNVFDYAWKRKDLDKLFDELLQWNFAITNGEVWLVEGNFVETLIPLKNGQIKVYIWKVEPKKKEDWYDYVERSMKETINLISEWDIEKTARVDKSHKIYYHFNFAENS